jgi:hypothetical protein
MRPGIAALIASLALGIFLTPLAADARQLMRSARLGVVSPLAPSPIETFWRGRRDLGSVGARDKGWEFGYSGSSERGTMGKQN